MTLEGFVIVVYIDNYENFLMTSWKDSFPEKDSNGNDISVVAYSTVKMVKKAT